MTDERDSIKIKTRIIEAGYKAIDQLLEVASDIIIKPGKEGIDGNGKKIEFEELTSDKLKNAAASKKLAIFDAFEILERIEKEKESLKDGHVDMGGHSSGGTQGFAERNSKTPGTRITR